MWGRRKDDIQWGREDNMTVAEWWRKEDENSGGGGGGERGKTT